MPVPSSPAAGAYTEIIAHTISARFNTRPTLRSATASLLKDELLEKYPLLDFDPTRTLLAQPQPEGGWRLTLLLDVVLAYLANGITPVLSEQFGRACFLTNTAPVHLSTGRHEPDMQVIAEIILEMPSLVFVGFQEALRDYWDEPVDAGVSRWQWLGDLLNGVLKASAVRRSSTHTLHADILTELTRYPDQQQRLEAPGANGVIHAFVVETTLRKDQRSVTLQSPDLLVSCGETLLLCSVTGDIESFPSLEAFGRAWGARFEQAFVADAITWKRYEPDGNLFDTQAALLLNQQLEDLAALKLPAGQPLKVLEKRYAAITDVAARFMGAQAAPNPMLFQHIEASLPEWLQTAGAVDRMAYRKQVLALASLKQQTAGRTFLTGIDDLHTFARKALHTQMLADQPQAPGYNADELELTFHVPVGDLGSGYIEPVKMTLTELAIKNLASKPKGRMTIRHTGGQLIQAWTTEAYLLDLVSRVNVGQGYPELIRTQLLADTPEARERARLFGLELAVHLPMQALEQSIKAEHGFTRQGYRYVEALMQRTEAERYVDEQQIVLRPLAFQRKPGADCDVASNLFIIEPRDLTVDGPRILYRPLYSPALLQYPSRQALMSAIAQEGPVQTSVLTWLSDRARPFYQHNGFNEPHIVHFHPGDEFARPETPEPAILLGNEAAEDWLAALEKGQLMNRLFDSNARALVELADRQSVSNTESRWAIILEGGWLLFNNLVLPLLRGPAMLVGWMLQLTHSLIQDLPALDSEDATAREQAWVDVLLNLGLVLLHVAQGRETPLSSDSQAPHIAAAPLRRSVSNMITDPVVTQAAPGLPSEPPGSGHTLLDFNLSTARDSSSARLFEKLQAVRVPWPSPLPKPIASGPFKGLFNLGGLWHATVGGLLFRVRIVPGFGEVFVVHPDHPDHPGIKLKTDGNGHWSLDQGLKLVGGGRKGRIAAEREKRQQRIEELNLQYEEHVQQQVRVQQRVNIADDLMLVKLQDTASTEQERTTFRKRFVLELDKQTDGYVTLVAGLKEKSQLTGQPVDYQLLSNVLENIINNVRKRIVIADFDREAANVGYSEYSSGTEQVYEALKSEGDVVVGRYFDFMRRISDINETMIESFEEVDRRLEELKQIPLLGAKAWQRLTIGRAENEMTALRVKVYHLIILRILSVKGLNNDTTLALEEAVDPLLILSRSHAELQTAHVYEPGDRIDVLDSLVDHYNKAQDALGSIGIFRADELEMHAFNRLRIIIDQLRIDAEQRLAQELQRSTEEQAQTSSSAGPSTGISKKPPKSPSATTRRKKVIKTTKGTLIGEIRPRIADQGGDIVDINGPLDDKPLASFHEHEPNVWVEIVEAREPAPSVISRPYPQLKGDARKAAAKVEEQVQKIEGYAKRASSPREIEEQLQREAKKLKRYADDLENHEEAPPANERDTAFIGELRDKARVLDNKAIELRTRMTLDQAPTGDGVEYLLRHNELYVRAVGTRVQLKTGRRDFMQEYALLKTDNQPWWYAHFHYAALDNAKADYTVAHLKTKAQRYETYESALAKTQDPKMAIAIHHGVIGKSLAERDFLPLQPR
ncbi:dermonecrotic toxin domain-containing protein [Pseudomonas frederiksbergensis]|uniref:dermonecrotic toxin domain-containing protein n=1 Tax=Pseudomonas frederiksbergensis TaxID=104087 RepID=UPI003D1DC07E